MSKKFNKILIVDDEEDLTWSLSKTLQRNNKMIEVICVNSGDDAFEVLKKNTIDLVISDIRLPGKSGLDLLDQIKRHHPRTKIIFMSAYSSPELVEKLKKSKNVYYLEKPFDIHKLKEMVLKMNWEEKDVRQSIDDVDIIFN